MMIEISEVLRKLGIEKINPGWSTGRNQGKGTGRLLEIVSPADGTVIGTVAAASEKEYSEVVAISLKAFEEWQKIPAPKRGEIVRQIGDQLRVYKEPLGILVAYEMG